MMNQTDQRSPRQSRRLAMVLVATAMILAACGGSSDSSGSGGSGATASDGMFDLSGTTLRITASDPGSLTAGSRYVFDRLQQWGAELDVIELSTTSGIQAIVARRADAGTHGADEAILGVAEGADVVSIGSPISRMDYVLVVKKDINSIDDLRGRTIAMSGPAGFDTLLTRLLMRNNGLNPDSDARFVQIGGSGERGAALLTGNVDAATIGVEDWFEVRSRTDDLQLLVALGEVVPDFPSDVYFGLRSFWEANTELATALACANLEANAEFIKGKQGYIDFALPIVTGGTAEGIGDSWDFAMSVDMWPQEPAGILNSGGFQALADSMLETGDITSPVDASRIVDLSYLEAAAAMGCGRG